MKTTSVLLTAAVLIGVVFLFKSAGAQEADVSTDIQGNDMIPTTPINNRVQALGQAVATAEGFGADATNFPTRNHNPGDLVSDLIGKAVGFDQGKAIYANDDDGWANTFHQLNVIALGQSHVYSLDETFSTFATKWTGGDSWESWLNTVNQITGTNPSTTLGEYLNG